MENPSALPSSNSSKSTFSAPKKSSSLIFILLFLLSSLLGGWFYYQNLQLKQQLINNQQSSKSIEAPMPQVTTSPSTPTTNPSPGSKNTLSPKLPLVVFEPPLSNEDYASQKTEIQQKIVDPFIDYHEHTSGEDYLVSLLIQQQNNEDIKDQFPYSLIGLFSNGGGQWESLTQTDDELDWWLPTCMGPCDYSEDFINKYPQIVSKTN